MDLYRGGSCWSAPRNVLLVRPELGRLPECVVAEWGACRGSVCDQPQHRRLGLDPVGSVVAARQELRDLLGTSPYGKAVSSSSGSSGTARRSPSGIRFATSTSYASMVCQPP